MSMCEGIKGVKKQLRKVVGENILAIRRARKQSREEFSEALCVSVNHIALIERGARGANLLVLFLLLRKFKVDINTLFNEEEGKEIDWESLFT